MPKKDDDDLDLTDDQQDVADGLEESRALARDIFGVPDAEYPTPEMIYGVFDRVTSFESASARKEAARQLEACALMAEGLFGAKPTANAVFGMFDRMFGLTDTERLDLLLADDDDGDDVDGEED